MKTKTKHGDETRRITSTRNLATATPPPPSPAAAAGPYTIPQVLANLREFVSIIAKTAASEKSWIRWVSENILARGISDPDVAQLRADLADCRATFDATAADYRKCHAALAHALAFIEHSHPNFDDPITEIDSFTSSADGGPEMECNLKLMRDALKGGK